MFQCQNDSCPSHETNLAFPMKEKSRVFTINCASVHAFQAIGGGHVTVSKIFCFLGLYTCNNNFELTNLSLIIVTCVRPESTVYSRHVPSKDLAYCISPVKRLLLLWMIRCYNPVAGKMPPKIFFSCFLGTKILES